MDPMGNGQSKIIAHVEAFTSMIGPICTLYGPIENVDISRFHRFHSYVNYHLQMVIGILAICVVFWIKCFGTWTCLSHVYVSQPFT